MNNAIEIKNLSKKYDNFELKNVSFNVPNGTIVGFVGVVLMNYIDLGSTSMLNGIFQLVVCGTISLIVVALFCWLFRVKEILQLFDAIKNKLKRN